MALIGLCAGLPVRARSLLVEASATRGGSSLSLLADLPILEDQLYATVCYGITRYSDGFAPTHQVCLGADYAFDSHWMISAVVSGSPKSVVRVDLLAPQTPNRFLFSSANSSLGATVSLAWSSDGFSDWEYSADATVGITGYLAPHTWWFRDDAGTMHHWDVDSGDNLTVTRPSLGVSVTWDGRLDLSLRGSYYLYAGNPLEVGRISETEINDLVDVYTGDVSQFVDSPERLMVAEQLAGLLENTSGGNILQADAISGVATAPVWFEVRPTVSWRFARWVKGQLGYAFARYVPTQGFAQVLSTKWTFTLGESWKLWGALALQTDRLEDGSRLTSGLLTAGAELEF